MYLINYGLGNKGLDKYLKSAISYYPSKSKMVKALKHVSNDHGGTFIMLIDHRQAY